ncbi:MAG: class F sortase, partial [Actinomycetota bacterium]|nr:class F sortase [Actinomycetota bacterium]
VLILAAAAAVSVLSGCGTTAPSVQRSATPTVGTGPSTSAAASVPDLRISSAALRPAPPVIPPTRVIVPGHDVDVPVIPVGLLPTGAMQLPDDPAIAGWYRYGPDARATSGSIVIAAHVDSMRYGLGPFVRIRDLPNGAPIRITDAEGKTTVYHVDRVQRTLKHALPTTSLFDRSGPRRLVLVTCGGTFDTVSRTYSDNVLVHAKAAR